MWVGQNMNLRNSRVYVSLLIWPNWAYKQTNMSVNRNRSIEDVRNREMSKLNTADGAYSTSVNINEVQHKSGGKQLSIMISQESGDEFELDDEIYLTINQYKELVLQVNIQMRVIANLKPFVGCKACDQQR